METRIPVNGMADCEMIVLGLGFREKVTVASFENALAKAGVAHFDHITVLARKAKHPALQEFAKKHRIVPHKYDQCELEGIQTQTMSSEIHGRFKVGSLSEALALKASNPNATLIHNRIISDDGFATLAIATNSYEGKIR